MDSLASHGPPVSDALDTLIPSAAGWPGSRTYRRACRPHNGLSRIFQGSLESLYGATFNPPVRCFGPLISHGIRSPRGVMRSISKSFRRLHLGSEAVQAFTALRKFITITVQRFLRRKKIKERLRVSASLF